MANYDYLNQSLTASLLIQPFDNESFFHPTTTGHTGFAYDGTHYTAGIQDPGPIFASWYTEAAGPYRGGTKTFPTSAVVILSGVALTIMDESQLTEDQSKWLWMQFLIQDSQLLGNNFNNSLIGFTPTFLNYSNGVLSVICIPDQGSTIQSNMVVTIDFVADVGYLNVAVAP